jgi:hypothetical protein
VPVAGCLVHYYTSVTAYLYQGSHDRHLYHELCQEFRLSWSTIKSVTASVGAAIDHQMHYMVCIR